MDKIKRQQDYFTIINNVLLKYPNLSYDELMTVTYSALIKLGVPIEEREKNLLLVFNTWLNDFDDIDNIEVKYDPSWKSFCRFENRVEEIDVSTAIKLYIPMDEEHIEEGCSQLFGFLAKQDIPHLSKVRNKISIDDVVVRVNSIEEAEKITNFVNKNNYIKQGILPSNPFLVDHQGIAHAMDGNTTSYNGVLCELITNYIVNKKKYDDINNINISDFKLYLQEINDYNIVNDNNPNNEKNNVVKLILNSTNSNDYTYDNFKNYVQIRKDQSSKMINVNYVLQDGIRVLMDRYGEEIAIKQLDKYLETGDYTKFSREENSREKAKLYLNKELVISMIKKVFPNEYTLKEFVQYIMDTDLEENKMKILEEASLCTYIKYNETVPAQLSAALHHLVEKGDYSYFTNKSECRKKLKNNVTKDIALELIEKQLIKDRVVRKNEEINNPINLYTMNIEKKYKASKGQIR